MINAHNNKLREYGEYLYEHVIVFCTSESDPRMIKASNLLEFFDAGRNLIVAGDIDTSKVFRQLFTNFGVELDVIGSAVQDHFHATDAVDHSIVYTSNVMATQPFIS